MTFSAGQKPTAAQLNNAAPTGTTQSATNTTAGTTTSTSYTGTLTGSGTVTVAGTAPPSGIIEVIHAASIANNTAGAYAAMAFSISGAITRAESDDDQLFVQCAQATGAGRPEIRGEITTRVSGLTPGAAFTISGAYKVTSGTGTFNYRRIMWRPVAA